MSGEAELERVKGDLHFGLMQDWALTVDRFLNHARRWHPRREVVTRLDDGTIERLGYAEIHSTASQLSNALIEYGIERGDRIATLAMNNAEHFAAWYAITGIGAICHTLNPRLFEEQLVYIVNHATDRVILADGRFAGLVERLLPRCPSLEAVYYFQPPNAADVIAGGATTVAQFRAEHDTTAVWSGVDERSAAGLCYTSGTTGNPKGVLYSHRSNFLHTMAIIQPDLFSLAERDVILPIVPMYHANAWGLTFAAPSVGAKLVLPGAQLDGETLFDLMDTEGVTFAAAVPTVWQGVIDAIRRRGRPPGALRRIVIGGAAMPEAILRDYHAFDIEVTHAWGMTELSPFGSSAVMTAEFADREFDDQLPQRLKQGRPPVIIDMKIVDENGRELPHDGRAAGTLLVRGPAVAAAYFRGEGSQLSDGGYFDTGDIATIDPYGFMQIVDRAKDIIKSGGEWISSQAIENAALSHPKAALAAVVGEPHPKWGERPILYVQLKEDTHAEEVEFITHLEGLIAKWWIPDRVVFTDRIPLGPTGKVDKKLMRTNETS